MVFDVVARFVEKHAREILVVEVLFTALLISLIPDNFRFESDLNKFLPDNPETQAHQRVEDEFGHDPSTYFVHVEPTSGDNVLSPDSIRDQKRLIERIQTSDEDYARKGHITGYISIVQLVEIQYNLDENRENDEDDWDRSIIGADDETVRENTSRMVNFLVSDDRLRFEGLWDSLQQYASSDDADETLVELVRTMTPEDLMVLSDLLLSKDLDGGLTGGYSASSTLIIVWIDGELEPPDRKEVAVSLRDDLGDVRLNETRIMETGADLLAHDVDEMTKVSNAILGVGILVIILVVLYLSFRSISYMILPVLTMGLAIVWTIGTMILLGVTFTAIDVAAIPLIVGLGVDDSVHLSKRYQEELRRCGKPAVALVTSIDKIGTAIFLTSLTTAMAFMSNMVSPIGPIRDFGLICATGIAFAFILTITFQAALRYEFDRYGAKVIECSTGNASPRLESGMRRFGSKVIDNPKPVVALVLVLTLSSIWASSYVRTDFRLEDFLPEDEPTVETYAKIEDQYNASSQSRVYYLIEGDDLATVDCVESLAELRERTNASDRLVKVHLTSDDEATIINRTYSILNYIELAIRQNDSLAGEYKFDNITFLPLPDCTDGDVVRFFDFLMDNESYTLKAQTVLSRVDDGGRWRYDVMVMRIFVDARSDTAKAKQTGRDMDRNMDAVDFPSGVKVSKAGYVISTISTIEAIQRSQIESTIISIIVAALLLMFIYRSFAVGVLAALPVAISASWVLGTMAFTEYMYANVSTTFPDISLNVLTVMVTALTIGLGIDYSIHIIQRFKEEREERGAEVREAMLTSISHSGTAIFISMITTVLGFVVLLFSPMPITQHFGLITSVTMVFAFFLCIFFLPVFLMIWARREEARVAEEGGGGGILSRLRPKPKPVEISIAGETAEQDPPREVEHRPSEDGEEVDGSVIVIVDEE